MILKNFIFVVPLDAYAFITYCTSTESLRAIAAVNGTVWLGQTVKCEVARVLPPTATVIQLYHRDKE